MTFRWRADSGPRLYVGLVIAYSPNQSLSVYVFSFVFSGKNNVIFS